MDDFWEPAENSEEWADGGDGLAVVAVASAAGEFAEEEVREGFGAGGEDAREFARAAN